MSIPTLHDLPSPPSGKTSWPWTEASEPLPEAMPGGEPWPKISIVTPSYNQGQFVEATIRSVLLQGYPNLEYVVIDGGSTDESVEVIRKYERWIDYWVSEPDRGQSHAINKGLFRCSGAHANWINSDDMLARDGLRVQATEYGFASNTLYAGDCLYVDESGRPKKEVRGSIQTLEELVDLDGKWRGGAAIQQPAVLFPLDTFQEIDGLDVENHYTMDYELWGRLLLAGVEIEYTGIRFGIFRHYEGQKISNRIEVTRHLVRSAKELVSQHPDWPLEKRKEKMQRLDQYWEAYWTNSGRLARLGLPENVVGFIRRFRPW